MFEDERCKTSTHSLLRRVESGGIPRLWDSAATMQLSFWLAYFTRTNPMKQSCCAFTYRFGRLCPMELAFSSPGNFQLRLTMLLSASFFSAGVRQVADLSCKLAIRSTLAEALGRWARQRQPIAMFALPTRPFGSCMGTKFQAIKGALGMISQTIAGQNASFDCFCPPTKVSLFCRATQL